MEGRTHRVGGVLCAMIGCSILESKGMLIEGVSPLVQLLVMYPFAVYGSILPDLDHNWNSAPAKDPVSKGINVILHATSGIRKKTGKSIPVVNFLDAKHRSWQTHSELFLAIFIYLAWLFSSGQATTNTNILLRMVFFGLALGVISHMILDALTPKGIWFLIPSIIRRKKVCFRLVPKSKFFATGGSWEKLVRTLLWIAVIFLLLYMVYLASPIRFEFNFNT